jgi:hypothetical protein
MATTTTNFGWDIPQSTDLVKDGATAIAALGQDIDTAMVDLKGGTTGQVLAKASGTDLDFSWVAQDDSNAIQNAIVDAKGDIIAATANDTPARLAVGTNGHVLTADSTAATGLKWAAAAGGLTLVKSQAIGSGVTSVNVTSAFSSTYNAYRIIVTGGATSANNDNLNLQLGSTTTGYYSGASGATYSTGANTSVSQNNTASFQVGFAQTNGLQVCIDLINPFLSSNTFMSGSLISSVNARSIAGVLLNTTSYTDFTLSTVTANSLTGGTIYVYGFGV